MASCICGCGGGACTPQRKYVGWGTDPLSSHELQEIILFRVYGKCGYPLTDALKKQYTGLDGRDEKMFIDSKSSISIRLEVRPTAPPRSNGGFESRLQWLPYRGWTKQASTDSRFNLCVSLHGH